MYKTKTNLAIAIIIFALNISIKSYAGNSISATEQIWIENFDLYNDNIQSSTKFSTNYTEPESEIELQTLGKSFWGVKNKRFVINDIEGTSACVYGGSLDNNLKSENINVSDYYSIKLTYTISTGDASLEGLYLGTTEVEGINLTEGIDGNIHCNSTDRILAYYSLDNGINWIEIGSLYGGVSDTTYNFASKEIIIDKSKNLIIRIVGGNSADDEYYYIDNIEVNGIKKDTPSDSTYWISTTSPDWTDENNWTPNLPNSNSHVFINKALIYPDISSIRVSCKNISFAPGTSVYGLQNLSYEKAFVNLELSRDKWYLLTSPLKGMYSSDYYFTGSPVSQIKLFGTTNASSSTFGSSYVVSGDWTKSFASLAEALTPGEGFAYLIGSNEFDYPNGVNTNTTNKVITLPRTELDGSLSTSVVPYSGISGKPYPSAAKYISKDNYKAYRFAMEDDGDTINTLSIHLEPGYNLIGNPLMSNLNLPSVINANLGLIEDAAYFWNGTSFESITKNGTTSSANLSIKDLIIPPMQSFVVNASPPGGELFISISDFTPNTASTLRSTRVRANQLFIETDNGKAKSSSAIVFNENSSNSFDETDVCKLCSQLSEVPEVYTIASNKALDINQINKCPSVIPIGIKSGVNEAVNISFKGVESFDNVEVRLINTASGENIDLKENNNYNYKFDGTNGEGNLFLEFRSTSINTATENASISNIDITTGKDNNILVSAPDSKQLEIFVYDTLGKLLAHRNTVSDTSQSINIGQKGSVFIVKVISDKGVETKKIVTLSHKVCKLKS